MFDELPEIRRENPRSSMLFSFNVFEGFNIESPVALKNGVCIKKRKFHNNP